MWFRRKRADQPEFPAELLAEARRSPGGHVYEIGSGFDPAGAIPTHAIRRGWEIGADGTPTGQYTDNPNFMVRQPLGDIDQLIADARSQSRDQEIELLVAHDLRRDNEPVPSEIGMSIIVDEIAALGFLPADPGRVDATEDGRRYRFERAT
jgi:hypothetical protein